MPIRRYADYFLSRTARYNEAGHAKWSADAGAGRRCWPRTRRHARTSLKPRPFLAADAQIILMTPHAGQPEFNAHQERHTTTVDATQFHRDTPKVLGHVSYCSFT